MIKYFIAILGGAVTGFVIAGLLASEKLSDLERENTHLEYEVTRLGKQLDNMLEF